MALPKSLTQPLRQGQLTVGSGWRAYFAPFNQTAAVQNNSTQIGPMIYDLEVTGKFIDGKNGPPAGWFDLGFLKNVKISPASKIGNVVAGYRGVTRAKYRAEVAETASWQFMEATRLAYKIATGTQVFNLLYSTQALTMGPISSSGSLECPVGASGYMESGLPSGPTMGLPVLFVPAGSGAAFPAGSMIVADADYNGTDYGFVGAAGANVFQGAVTDVDFIRKTSDFISGVKAVIPNAAAGQDAIVLTGPFVGGGQAPLGTPQKFAPEPGDKVQAVVGYAAREGGTALTEWSAVLCLDTIDASQMLIYYPRLAPSAFTGWEMENLQGATSMQTSGLAATYEAMAYDDPLDGETVVRYLGYYPHPGTNPQI
jgi:hypothetical protein